MKYALCFLVLAASATNSFAQFDHGETGVLRARVKVDWTVNEQSYTPEDVQRKVLTRTESQHQVATQLTLRINEPDPEKTLREFAASKRQDWWKHPPAMISGQSYTRTLAEGEERGTSSVPSEPIGVKMKSQHWTLECENQQLQLTSKSDYTATATKLMFHFAISPDSSATEYRVIAWIGGLDLGRMSGTREYANFYTDCVPTWSSADDPPYINNHAPNILGQDALLMDREKDLIDEEGKPYAHVSRQFGAIPLEALHEYLKAPQSPRTFTVPFRDKFSDSDSDLELVGTITIEFGPTTIDSGKILLSFDGDYDSWYPTLNADQSMKRISVTAASSDQKLAPTRIRFTLGDVSRYPGIATNYPINGFGSLDMHFPREQPDGIQYVDSFTVMTKDKVRSATATILVNDYAATARLYAAPLDKTYEVKEKYGDLQFLQLPKDRNGNSIGDAWEKEAGITGDLAATADSDELPLGQKRSGDGYSLFEEYRGLITVDNVAGKADKVAKQGKHVRMNPNHKDVAILDESGLFKKYYAAPNPAELTWHLLSRSQAIIKPLKINGKDIHEDPKNRIVNHNTPKALRTTDQRLIHLTFHSPQYPPDDDMSTAGAAIRRGDLALRNTLYVWMRPLHELEKAVVDQFAEMDSSGRYTGEDKRKATIIQQENTVIHEVGHALGIRHHCNGVAKIRYKGKDVLITCENINDEKPFEPEAASRGVHSCAMLYSLLREGEFRMKEVLNHQTRYCHEGETYIDDLMNIQPADNCFGQVDVSCETTDR